MKTEQHPTLVPGCKLWLSSPTGAGAFGDGKWRLLQAVQEHGSLVAACERLGISYRKAWGDLRKAEKRLGVRLLEKHRGGSGGGETHLTDKGREWLRAYELYRQEVQQTIEHAYATHLSKLLAETQ